MPGHDAAGPRCRACHHRAGELVLDLGEQPACDYFPRVDDPGPDPLYPLQMWLCASCGLAQLVADATVPEEPRGTEPAALVAQAADAVERVAHAGLLAGRSRVVEFGSPHGGSWLGLLSQRGFSPVTDGGPAHLVLDTFGMMHAADQSAALAERGARLAPGGLLLLQYHALETIVGHGQWNVLRHGHFAYYSTAALSSMLGAAGMVARRAWTFDLYGGTVLLAATRSDDTSVPVDDSLRSLLAADDLAGVRDPATLRGLGRTADGRARRLRQWLVEQRQRGRRILGYGAASRAVALLRRAEADRTLLPAVVDASPSKRGLRMPGTDIPVVDPDQLTLQRPEAVLLLLADLLDEVRAAYPAVEEGGGVWVDVEGLGDG